MRICFLADGRSPIAKSWIRPLIDAGHDVHVISSFPCEAGAFPGAALHVVPIAFSGPLGTPSVGRPGGQPRADLRATARRLAGRYGQGLWHLLGGIELFRHRGRIRRLIAGIEPDLVHALRIPYEGIMAALATPRRLPLLVSVWGNDFTLQAPRNPVIGALTRMTMRRADGVLADCRRDIHLAHEWGLASSRPTRVLPGAGGIDLATFHRGEPDRQLRDELAIAREARVIINPRGIRTYVENEAFFAAMPRVIAAEPRVVFLCASMAGQPSAARWVEANDVAAHVRLLAPVSHTRMADLFRLAELTVSPSRHDGTPNSLLEAMACGCYPIAGDIESIREWVEPEVNGLLCDPGSPEAIAAAIVRALSAPDLEVARVANVDLIGRRAERGEVKRQAEAFYREITTGRHQDGPTEETVDA